MPICKPSYCMFFFIHIILPNHYHMFMRYTKHDKKIHYTDNFIFIC